jgi:hypothetical protein
MATGITVQLQDLNELLAAISNRRLRIFSEIGALQCRHFPTAPGAAISCAAGRMGIMKPEPPDHPVRQNSLPKLGPSFW